MARGALLAVVVLGMASLTVTGQLSAPAAVLALPASLLVLMDTRSLRVPNAVWNLLGAAALLGAGYAYLGLGRPLLSVLAHLTVFLQIYRLLVRVDTRGNLIVVLLAFAQLLLAAILTIRLGFLLVFLGFSITAAWALLLLHLEDAERRQSARGPVPAGASSRTLLGPVYLLYVTSMSIGLLLGTGAIFLLLPRLQIGLAEGFAAPVHVSGFSEEVRLGDVGLIQRNNDPVMRVSVTDPEGAPVALPLYYHGLALDTFDGQRWRLDDATTVSLVNQEYGRLDRSPAPEGTTVSQRYVLEPMNSRVVFYVRTPLSLLVPLHRLEAATTEGYYFPRRADRPEYTVHSRVVRPAAQEFRDATAPYPDEIAGQYLQVPDLEDRVLALAQRWIDMGDTAYDSALVVQEQLSTGFTYSLDQPSAGKPDPIDHFLFESQEGHCEFFATAMAVMLRSQGIPTRMVNGFHGGEYNPAGDYFIVRQRHAHSWVEVYFPELGWQVFDPTPVAAFDEQAQLRFGARLRGWIDLASLRWRTLVLDYDQQAQLDAVQRAQRAAGSSDPLGLPSLSFPGLQTSDGEGRGTVGRLAGAAALILVLVAGILFLRWAIRWRRVRDPWDRVAPTASRRFVQRVRGGIARLRRRLGDRVSPHATAREIAEVVRDLDPDAGPELAELVERYYAVRFGGREADEDDLRSARRTLGGARRLRPHRGISGRGPASGDPGYPGGPSAAD